MQKVEADIDYEYCWCFHLPSLLMAEILRDGQDYKQKLVRFDVDGSDGAEDKTRQFPRLMLTRLSGRAQNCPSAAPFWMHCDGNEMAPHQTSAIFTVCKCKTGVFATLILRGGTQFE